MIKKFLTLEFIKTEAGEERILIRILDTEVKERIFHSVDEAIEFIQRFLKETGKKEVSK